MKRMLPLLLALAMLLSMLAGCGKTESTASVPSEPSAIDQPSQAPEPAASTPEPTQALSVAEPVSVQEDSEIPDGPVAGDKDFDWSVFEPLTDTPTTLTMFYTQPPPLAAIMDSPNDMSLLDFAGG